MQRVVDVVDPGCPSGGSLIPRGSGISVCACGVVPAPAWCSLLRQTYVKIIHGVFVTRHAHTSSTEKGVCSRIGVAS